MDVHVNYVQGVQGVHPKLHTLQAAFAYWAIKSGIFNEDLYLKRGGRGKVRDMLACILRTLLYLDQVEFHIWARNGLALKPPNFECWLSM